MGILFRLGGTNFSRVPYRNPNVSPIHHMEEKSDDVFRVLGPGRFSMTPFLMMVIGVHGLIHLLGFFHAFHIIEIELFTQTISPAIGILWLTTTLIFLITVYCFATNKTWWWVSALVSLTTSQILIFFSWYAAKFGTLVNIVILVPIIMEIAVRKFTNQVYEEKQIILSRSLVSKEEVITEQMIAPLPVIVQKWLANIGMIGQESIRNAYFKQTGRIKLKPEQKHWFNAVSEQYISTDQPAFLWKVNMTISCLNVMGRDLFMDGKGQMDINLAALFSVAKGGPNDKINESSLQRYLLEMPWYPSLAVHPNITWKQHDEYSATATLNVQDTTGSATFFFDTNGEFIKSSALRFKDNDVNAQRIECMGEVKKSQVINGIKIPTEMDVSWMLEGQKKFTWYQINVKDVVYNLNAEKHK